MGNVIFSIDVEPDLHSLKYEGVIKGIKKFERLCDKNNIKPVLFVTADCIKKHGAIFKKLNKKGWEISSHGLSHRRFDEMSYKEKEFEIKESLRIFKKYLNIRPKGFRAPQHSIDSETLDLLDKYKFEYDSSYAPLNLFQLIFFPRKVGLWFKQFFSRINPYKIRRNLSEIPTAALLIPFISLSIRIAPLFLLKLYVPLIKKIYKNPVFYAHSWDFIELKKSKIDRFFSHKKLIQKLGEIMENEQKS